MAYLLNHVSHTLAHSATRHPFLFQQSFVYLLCSLGHGSVVCSSLLALQFLWEKSWKSLTAFHSFASIFHCSSSSAATEGEKNPFFPEFRCAFPPFSIVHILVFPLVYSLILLSSKLFCLISVIIWYRIVPGNMYVWRSTGREEFKVKRKHRENMRRREKAAEEEKNATHKVNTSRYRGKFNRKFHLVDSLGLYQFPILTYSEFKSLYKCICFNPVAVLFPSLPISLLHFVCLHRSSFHCISPPDVLFRSNLFLYLFGLVHIIFDWM